MSTPGNAAQAPSLKSRVASNRDRSDPPQEGDKSPHNPSFNSFTRLHSPALSKGPRYSEAEPEITSVISASTHPRFHASEQDGLKGRPRHLASSPVPKNGVNACSKCPSSRLASLQPACQFAVAPTHIASSRNRAEYPAWYWSVTAAGSLPQDFRSSNQPSSLPCSRLLRMFPTIPSRYPIYSNSSFVRLYWRSCTRAAVLLPLPILTRSSTR